MFYDGILFLALFLLTFCKISLHHLQRVVAVNRDVLDQVAGQLYLLFSDQ